MNLYSCVLLFIFFFDWLGMKSNFEPEWNEAKEIIRGWFKERVGTTILNDVEYTYFPPPPKEKNDFFGLF